MPLPLTAGSCQRTALLIGALQKNHQVDLFLLRGPQQAQFLKDHGYRVAGFAPILELTGWKKAILRLLRHISQEYRLNQKIFDAVQQVFESGGYDLAIGRYLKPSEMVGVSSLSPSLVDLDDLDTSVLANRLQTPGTPLWQKPFIRWKLQQLQGNFDTWVSRYSRCWVSSENDLPLLKRGDVDVVSNIAWQTSPRPGYQPSGNGKQMLRVGSFNHQPNLVGLDRFIERIWPRIHQAEPAAQLCVVGSGLPETKRQKWSSIPGIKVLGFVDKLDQVYVEAAFSVVPLWDGAGTKIKVIESLSYGRTALVTSHAMRGFEKNTASQ